MSKRRILNIKSARSAFIAASLKDSRCAQWRRWFLKYKIFILIRCGWTGFTVGAPSMLNMLSVIPFRRLCRCNQPLYHLCALYVWPLRTALYRHAWCKSYRTLGEIRWPDSRNILGDVLWDGMRDGIGRCIWVNLFRCMKPEEHSLLTSWIMWLCRWRTSRPEDRRMVSGNDRSGD